MEHFNLKGAGSNAGDQALSSEDIDKDFLYPDWRRSPIFGHIRSPSPYSWPSESDRLSGSPPSFGSGSSNLSRDQSSSPSALFADLHIGEHYPIDHDYAFAASLGQANTDYSFQPSYGEQIVTTGVNFEFAVDNSYLNAYGSYADGYNEPMVHAGTPNDQNTPQSRGMSVSPIALRKGGPSRSKKSSRSTPASALRPVRPEVATPAMKEKTGLRRTREASFLCEHCPQDKPSSFTTWQNLDYHIRSHYDIRDFDCEVCKKTFVTPHTRTRHQRKCRARKYGAL